MNDQHHLHTRKYRQQKMRRYRYHPYTEPATTSSSTHILQNRDSTPTMILPMEVIDDEEDKSRERHGGGRQYRSHIQGMGTSINDPEPSISEKLKMKGDDHHLQLHFSTSPSSHSYSSKWMDHVRVPRNTFHHSIQKNLRTWTSRESGRSTTQS